ncbi:MAG: glycosyltransferase [candidate division KSB1 bacterium]|nr:glycosyltransferase [candidate division KSB1 bacterium]MDZ7365676.1 glycosyltransferase [candidate division KSB1 bacterium]MDZ7403248.1 glycosyltransferase [candidate division KSB1 bacterium]
MKLAYIMSRFPKISETFILYEILEQERLGHPVEVYPLLREHQPVTHPEAERLVERAHFHPFISLPIIWANAYYMLRQPFAYLKTLFEVLSGTFGSLNFFAGALAYFPKSVRFAYEMHKQGIEHIHAHFCNHPAVAALIIHRLTGIPYSFTAHGSDLHKDKRMLDKKVAACAFAVTVSNFNKGEMLKACGERQRDKIHVIRCGIDPEVFLPAEEQKNGKTLFRIICVGSFEEVKGHKYLVEACRRLREAGIDFVCDLIGDGPVRGQVAKQIAELDLKDKVIIHGSLKRQSVAEMMRAADVKVLASVPTAEGKREGVPVVIMEAMATGLPVISTQLSGIPELVDDGRTGILVPPGDTQALFVALQKLYENPGLRQSLGRAGREKVLREFNLRLNVIKLANLFAAAKP